MSLRSKAAKAEPSPALKAQLQASLAEPFQTAAETEVARRARRHRPEDDPNDEEFWRAFGAIGTALCRAAHEMEEPESKLIDWCGRQVAERAEAARQALHSGGA